MQVDDSKINLCIQRSEEQVAESVNAGVLLEKAKEEIKSKNSSISTLRQQGTWRR